MRLQLYNIMAEQKSKARGERSTNSKSGGLEEEQEERACRGGRDLWAMVSHCCSLVGSHMWHLELIDSDSMETSSCGIVNRLRDWKDERESGFRCTARLRGPVSFLHTHVLRSMGANEAE